MMPKTKKPLAAAEPATPVRHRIHITLNEKALKELEARAARVGLKPAQLATAYMLQQLDLAESLSTADSE